MSATTGASGGGSGLRRRCSTSPEGSILPGFRDSHIHPLTGSFSLLECRLTGPADREAYLGQVLAYARANSDQSFIRGGGWLPDAFPPLGPNRADLDSVVADRPVILTAMDGHSAWVNTRALEEAGIDRKTPDPPGGLIVRDPADRRGHGDPPGVVGDGPGRIAPPETHSPGSDHGGLGLSGDGLPAGDRLRPRGESQSGGTGRLPGTGAGWRAHPAGPGRDALRTAGRRGPDCRDPGDAEDLPRKAAPAPDGEDLPRRGPGGAYRPAARSLRGPARIHGGAPLGAG